MRSTWTLCLTLIVWIASVQAADKPPTGNAELADWVDARVAERQPPAADKRFDEIGWVADIRTAERLAKEHARPVFLFTHDGRMNLGRC